MIRALNRLLNYFTKGEIFLWSISAALIIIFFLVFDRANILTLTASLTGVTSLIFNAKGNPTGQILIIVFSALYGIISYTFSYYGEILTYGDRPKQSQMRLAEIVQTATFQIALNIA